MPVLEKILAAVKRNLTIENCCDQLRAILMLKRTIKLKTQEEGEECYPEVRTLSQWPNVNLLMPGYQLIASCVQGKLRKLIAK